MKKLNTIIFSTRVKEKMNAMQKALTFTLILFLTTTHLNILAQNEINFIKLNENIGIVIDSLENEQCKCLRNQNSETFKHAFIIQRPDSFIVLHAKHNGSDTYKKEFLTPVSIKTIYNQSEKYAKIIKPYYNTTSENQIAQQFAGKANFNSIKYEEIYFVDYLTKSLNRKYSNDFPSISRVVSTDTNTFYINFALNWTYSPDVGIYLISKKNIGVSISRTVGKMKAKNLPPDYHGDWGIFSDGPDPKDNIEFYSLRVTGNFGSPYQTGRFGIEVGVSACKVGMAQFTEKNNPQLFHSNYNVTHDNKFGAGASIKVKFEYPGQTWNGVEFSTIYNINKYHSYGTLQLGVLIGRVSHMPKY